MSPLQLDLTQLDSSPSPSPSPSPRTGDDLRASGPLDHHQNRGGTVARRWADAGVRPLAPEVVATGWLSALLVRLDWTTLWSTTDPNLRLACAQEWLDRLDRTGDNVTAWSLAAEVPHLGMWAPFADQQFSRWSTDLCSTGGSARTGGDLLVPSVTDRYQLGSGARADVGRELCVVSIASTGPTRHLTLRLRDRWRIAGLGAGVVQPGWPARWLDLCGPPGLGGSVVQPGWPARWLDLCGTAGSAGHETSVTHSVHDS